MVYPKCLLKDIEEAPFDDRLDTIRHWGAFRISTAADPTVGADQAVAQAGAPVEGAVATPAVAKRPPSANLGGDAKE